MFTASGVLYAIREVHVKLLDLHFRCYSMVGRQPGVGAQRVSIGNGCGHLGVVVHEIGMKMF